MLELKIRLLNSRRQMYTNSIPFHFEMSKFKVGDGKVKMLMADFDQRFYKDRLLPLVLTFKF